MHAQAGICAGQRVAAVADPMRPATMYELMDRPSLRFVMETLRMQRNSVSDIVLEELLSPAEVDALTRPAAAGRASDDGTDASAASVSSYDPADAAGNQTVGEPAASARPLRSCNSSDAWPCGQVACALPRLSGHTAG